MAGGVTTPLQTPRHRTDPQVELGHQGIDQAALAHPGRAAEHADAGLLQPPAQGVKPLPPQRGYRQRLVAPALQPSAPGVQILACHQIRLGEHQLHRNPGALSGEQKTVQLGRIEAWLLESDHHHHPAAVGHGGTLQLGAALGHGSDRPPARPPVDTLHTHAITNEDALAALAQAGAAHAEQLPGGAGFNPIQAYPAEIGLQGRHQALNLRRGLSHPGGCAAARFLAATAPVPPDGLHRAGPPSPSAPARRHQGPPATRRRTRVSPGPACCGCS